MKGNTVAITGNLTRDAEIRKTQSGNTVVSFALCWNSSRKNQQGGYEDVPHYFDVQAWVTEAQLRVVQPVLLKGARCSITEAHLVQQTWQDNQGNNRSKVLIQVDDPIQGMTVKPRNAQEATQGAYNAQAQYRPSQQQNGGYMPQQGYQQPLIDAASSVYDDDIPF